MRACAHTFTTKKVITPASLLSPDRPFPPFTTPLHTTARFFSFAGPVFFALFGKTVCYTSLGIAAQFTGAIPLAGTCTDRNDVAEWLGVS
jgi:hypothetical protein